MHAKYGIPFIVHHFHDIAKRKFCGSFYNLPLYYLLNEPDKLRFSDCVIFQIHSVNKLRN